MCMICREEYEGSRVLYLSCPDLKNIPEICNLRRLVCDNCPLLTTIPVIPGLQRLECQNCPLLESIPVISGLKTLYCIDCPMTSIPIIENLEYLICWDCPLITEIPEIPGLKTLDCRDCPRILRIPHISGLKEFIYNNVSITIPEISDLKITYSPTEAAVVNAIETPPSTPEMKSVTFPLSESIPAIEAAPIVLKCLICHVNQIQTVCIPCMHCCFCVKCVSVALTYSKQCPTCRKDIERVSTIYFG
jgi:hypothetical protein